ncbi:MAG: ATP-binding cassette domain-containing protein, partial [Proteobacteria bacterium]|nr:ATP-binding cassette domain-containing protein [Pseudomonadota bacterium]
MLALEGVHAHYGLAQVLQGVSIGVAEGEVVGVFGRNGVGKTTLVK